jgi:hypothetical protein
VTYSVYNKSNCQPHCAKDCLLAQISFDLKKIVDCSNLDEVAVWADLSNMNLVWWITRCKVVEMTWLIANSIFWRSSILNNVRFFVSLSIFNIENMLRTCSLCTLCNQLFRFSVSLTLRQLLFCQVCSLSCSSFFKLLEMIAIDAFTRSTNLFSNEQSMFWCMLSGTSVREWL